MPDIISGVDINEKPIADLGIADSYKLFGSVDGAVKRIDLGQLPFIALPTEGREGQVLTTDGSGSVSWEDAEVSDEQVEEAVAAYEATNIYSPVSQVEISLTASRAYAVGDFFVYHQELYKVTATIASGEAIVIGTNCQKTYASLEIQGKQSTLTFDDTPAAGSTNPVTSDGIKSALDQKANTSATIAVIEAEAIASQNYAAGEYLVLNGQLYKTTAAITSGTALVENTNIVATTTGDELADISGRVKSNLPLWLNVGTVSSLPTTVSNVNITSDMLCSHWELGNPSAMTSDWSVIPSNGSVTITGSISGSTTLKIKLERVVEI